MSFTVSLKHDNLVVNGTTTIVFDLLESQRYHLSFKVTTNRFGYVFVEIRRFKNGEVKSRVCSTSRVAVDGDVTAKAVSQLGTLAVTLDAKRRAVRARCRSY